MLLDAGSLFAKDISIVDGAINPVDIGVKGLGRGNGMNFFMEISDDVIGLTSATFRLFNADDEEGTLNKEEIFVSPEYLEEKLTKGFSFIIELPATAKRYLILEVEKNGVATDGRFWAGLTGSEQYAAHNV